MSRRLRKNLTMLGFMTVVSLILFYPSYIWMKMLLPAWTAGMIALFCFICPVSLPISYMLRRGKIYSVLHFLGEYSNAPYSTGMPHLILLALAVYLRVPINLKLFGSVLFGVYAIMVLVGLINGRVIHSKHYNVEIMGMPSFRLAVFSDLHLGTFTDSKLTERIAAKICDANADAVIFAGDIFDNTFEELRCPECIQKGMLKIAGEREIYACEGNHDLFSPSEKTAQYLKECRVNILKDETVRICGVRFLFRRDGKDKERRPLSELIEPNSSEPFIVVDHHPVHYRESWENGAAIVLSAHTHGGQTFPGNVVYRNPDVPRYGHIEDNGRHLFVSSGAGRFGCPIRLGVNSEIMIIDINKAR